MNTNSALNKIVILGTLLAFSLVSCGQIADTVEPTPTDDLRGSFVEATPETEVNTFDRFWDTINELYVYRDEGTVSWAAVRDQYRSLGIAADGTTEMEKLVEEIIAFFPENTIAWQTRDERIERQTAAQATANYQGIGAFVTYRDDPRPHIVLIAVMDGSPAQAAGLKDHDSIFGVDGVSVTAEEGIDIVQRVRGPAGTQVTLTVQSPPSQATRDVIVTRGTIDATAPQHFTFRFLPGTDILYVHVPRSGYSGMAEEFFGELIKHTNERDVTGVILDMRISTGSTANWPLLGFLSAFGDGKMGDFYSLQETDGVAVEGQDFNGTQAVPLAILVGPDTSGLPEIFAASLKDNGRASVVGLPTNGAVEIYNGFAMPDGSELSLATVSFITSTGTNVGLNGLQPNFIVDVYWDAVTETSDPVIDFAQNIISAE